MMKAIQELSTRSIAAIVAWVIVIQLSLYAIYVPLENKMVDRYHGADAARDFALVHARLAKLEKECYTKKETNNGNN